MKLAVALLIAIGSVLPLSGAGALFKMTDSIRHRTVYNPGVLQFIIARWDTQDSFGGGLTGGKWDDLQYTATQTSGCSEGYVRKTTYQAYGGSLLSIEYYDAGGSAIEECSTVKLTQSGSGNNTYLKWGQSSYPYLNGTLTAESDTTAALRVPQAAIEDDTVFVDFYFTVIVADTPQTVPEGWHTDASYHEGSQATRYAELGEFAFKFDEAIINDSLLDDLGDGKFRYSTVMDGTAHTPAGTEIELVKTSGTPVCGSNSHYIALIDYSYSFLGY